MTGASRGIGAATATMAAASGWAVAVNYRSDRAAAERIVSEIVAAGGVASAIAADVSVEADVVSMFDTVQQQMGAIGCLVNNAGVAPGYGAFADITVADMERTWAVNLTGAFLCAREAVRRMSTNRGGAGGSIVNVSSRAAAIGGPNEWIHYAASKGGLDSLTSGLSKEVALDGIRVNTVRPGLMEHEFKPWSPEGRTERLRVAIPMQRGGTADEVASAIVWLAGDEASYVTGAFLDVAGGR